MTKTKALTAAGKVAAQVHRLISQKLAVGVNLLELEALAKDEIKRSGLQPGFLGYKGYPAVTCLSVNDEIVHGIPRSYRLQSGDVLSVDLGVACEGWNVDTARTYVIGQGNEPARQLIKVSQTALDEAITVCRPGQTIGDIGHIIQQTVEKAGYFILKDLTGHGVGQTLQEPPNIPNYGSPGQGEKITEGMVLAIEPITALAKTDIAIAADGWTIISRDGTTGVHVEDTVLVTANDPIVLTR